MRCGSRIEGSLIRLGGFRPGAFDWRSSSDPAPDGILRFVGGGRLRWVVGCDRPRQGVPAIWQPAGVAFGPIHVETIAVPAEVLEAIARSGDTNAFFDQVGRTFDVSDPGIVNGFYVAAAAGVNGFTPTGSTVFFVVDEPSVHDERVSSHEIGHILGLRHAADDAGRLMFSGTNGMALTGQEIEVARYSAEGLADGTR